MLASKDAGALAVGKLGSHRALLHTLSSHHYFFTVKAPFTETRVPAFGASPATIGATADVGVIELGWWAFVKASPTHLDQSCLASEAERNSSGASVAG